MRSSLPVYLVFSTLGLLFSPSAYANETRALKDCYYHNVTALEPHQNNMLDLSEIVASATCQKLKIAFFEKVAKGDPELNRLYDIWLRTEVQQMVLEARSSRLGINIKLGAN